MGEPLTIRTLRERNRAAVLRHIITAGRTTRAQIAGVTGLSPASSTNIVGDLIAEGLVAETGLMASQGGRPTSVIQPAADGAYFVGADFGERGVTAELFDLTMTRVDRVWCGDGTQGSGAVAGRRMSAALAALRDRNGERWSRVAGVGLGLPGIVETSPGGERTVFAEALGWDPVPVRELCETDLPIFAENGAKTLAMAERWFGAARGIDNATVVLIGRGVGLGVITGGRLLRGEHSSASEWGHLRIDPRGPVCRCGRRGCVEAVLGSQGVLARWAERGGPAYTDDAAGISALFDAAEAGDALASAVVDDLIADAGAALGGLVNLFNPQRLIVGGWLGMLWMQRFGQRIDVAVRAAALTRPGRQYELDVCSFGDDTVALGAAVMPLERLIAAPAQALLPRSSRSVRR